MGGLAAQADAEAFLADGDTAGVAIAVVVVMVVVMAVPVATAVVTVLVRMSFAAIGAVPANAAGMTPMYLLDVAGLSGVNRGQTTWHGVGRWGYKGKSCTNRCGCQKRCEIHDYFLFPVWSPASSGVPYAPNVPQMNAT